MKIWDGIPKVGHVYEGPKGVKKTEKTGSVASNRDELSISSQAKDIQTAMKALKDIPDIRKDKVEAIQKKIEAGTYQVREEDIADKILKSIAEKKSIE
jgi:negative regulator of flagellin synthesis FlgM